MTIDIEVEPDTTATMFRASIHGDADFYGTGHSPKEAIADLVWEYPNKLGIEIRYEDEARKAADEQWRNNLRK